MHRERQILKSDPHQMPSLHLLMWVYRGGDPWHQALGNALEHRSIFKSFIASFNGPDREILASEMQQDIWQELTPHILMTGGDLHALEHSIWVAESPAIQCLPADDLLLLLAEDDVINWPAMLPMLAEARKVRGPLVFGRWGELDVQTSPATITDIEGHSDKATRARTLIGRHRPGVEPVNISGLVVTAATFRRAHQVMNLRSRSKLLLSGVRTEYFLATQPTVRTLLRSDEPVALIRRHAGQGSLAIKRADWQRSETLFQLWLITSFYPKGFSLQMLTWYRFLRSFLQSPRSARHLLRSVQHFRNISKQQ
jgi:hypothetical protein